MEQNLANNGGAEEVDHSEVKRQKTSTPPAASVVQSSGDASSQSVAIPQVPASQQSKVSQATPFLFSNEQAKTIMNLKTDGLKNLAKKIDITYSTAVDAKVNAIRQLGKATEIVFDGDTDIFTFTDLELFQQPAAAPQQ